MLIFSKIHFVLPNLILNAKLIQLKILFEISEVSEIFDNFCVILKVISYLSNLYF